MRKEMRVLYIEGVAICASIQELSGSD